MKGTTTVSTERLTLDVSHNPELLSVAREVKETGTSRVLQANGEELAEIKPVGKRPRLHGGKRTSANDPFWGIVGMVPAGAPDNASEHVDEILADFETGKH
jgi:hypothetical protein